jgi:hypothetical protein
MRRGREKRSYWRLSTRDAFTFLLSCVCGETHRCLGARGYPLGGEIGRTMLFQSCFWPGYVAQRVSRWSRTACLALFLAASGLSAAADETNWTVLTVARNGNWGIASARTQGEAIAGALLRCQAMTANESDCGAELVAFRSGLALALMCGDHRVIVTANDAEEADSAALDRLVTLRGLHGPDFPVCQHLLQIDSYGVLTTFKAKRFDEGGNALPTSSD